MPTVAPPLYVLSDALRHVLWWVMVAFIAVGSFWGGGFAAREAYLEVSRNPRGRDPRSEDRLIEREAARGLAELERFLDQQPHG